MRSLVGALVRNRVPVPFVSRTPVVFPFFDRSNREQHLRQMESLGTLFAIVHRTSNATSQVEWKLWRKAESGLDADRTEVTRHAALDIWQQPNPFMTGQEFVETFQQHVDLVGEGWWVVGRNRSPLPLELWPVRPDRMEPVPSRTEFLSGYVHHGPDGEQTPLRLKDVVMLRMPNPVDPYRGLGPVQAAMVDIDSARFGAEWNRNFFVNGAEPGGIIEIDKRLSDEEFDDMTKRWREQHQGVANAHRVALLEQGKWVERKFTMRDMQFTELRRVSKEMIRDVFTFPKPMLGDVEDVNRANADAAEVVFARWLLVPRLERIKGALNGDFLPLFGPGSDRLEFDYENPVPESAEQTNADRDSRVAAAKALVEVGFDPADVLDAMDLPEIRHVGIPAVPVRVPQAIDQPIDVAALLASVEGGLPRGRHPFAQADEVDRQAAEVAADFDEALEAVIVAWRPITTAQRDQLVDQIREALAVGDTEALSRLVADASDATGLLAERMAELAAIAAETMAGTARRQDVDADPGSADRGPLDERASSTALMLATGLATAAGQEALRLLVPGATAEEIATQVGELVDGLSDRTLRDRLGGALSAAQNQGRIATLRNLPEPTLIATEVNDRNTCDPCSGIDRFVFDSIRAAEEAYGNGGFVDCLGRDRCRGTIVAIWEQPAEAA